MWRQVGTAAEIAQSAEIVGFHQGDHALQVAEQLRAARTSGALRLNGVDREIVRGLVAGRSNDEIAQELGVARKTVESRLTRLFSRLEVGSRTELALRAEREGWLELPGAR